MVKNRRLRSETGSGAIAELGPALFILFLLILFPLINLLSLALVWNSGNTLENLLLKQAIVSPASTFKSTTAQTIIDSWKQSGIGNFVHLSNPGAEPTMDTPTYTDNSVGDKVVTVTIHFSTEPFIKIPFFVAVPGVSAPVPWTFNGSQIMEDPANVTL